MYHAAMCTQGHLKITRGWAGTLGYSITAGPPYSRKPFLFFSFLFFQSFLTIIYVKFRIFFFLLICQLTLTTLFCVKCEDKWICKFTLCHKVALKNSRITGFIQRIYEKKMPSKLSWLKCEFTCDLNTTNHTTLFIISRTKQNDMLA